MNKEQLEKMAEAICKLMEFETEFLDLCFNGPLRDFYFEEVMAHDEEIVEALMTLRNVMNEIEPQYLDSVMCGLVQ